MGCVSRKTSYEQTIDDFFLEMNYNRMGFSSIFNAILKTFPEEGKVTTLSKYDFEQKIYNILLQNSLDSNNTMKFWKDIYEKNFCNVGGYPIFYMYLALICMIREVKETSFFKALHKFYEKIEEPKIKMENDILYADRDFLNEFTFFYYRLVTLMAIPYVFCDLEDKKNESKEKLNVLYDKKKTFSYINDLFQKLEVKDGYVEFSKYYKLFPLKGDDIREIIAGRPSLD